MARPRRCRRVCAEPDYGSFRPDGIPGGESVTLTVDEYEVIRLIDLEKLTHEQCAKRMDISRTTVTEIYETAREKIADSIVNGRVLLIAGGDYRLCDGSAVHFCRKRCGRAPGLAGEPETRTAYTGEQTEESGPHRISAKGEHTMRIAEIFISISDTQSSLRSTTWKTGRSQKSRSQIPTEADTGRWQVF